MPKINIDNLEPNSTYRIYLRGESYNLPFIDIKTPKILVKSNIASLISSAEVTSNTAPLTPVNQTIPGITASATHLYYIKRIIRGSSTACAVHQLLFVAPSTNYSGDWNTYLSGKTGTEKVTSVSFQSGTATYTDTSACLNFNGDALNKTSLQSGSLFLSMHFKSNNKTSTLKNLIFPIPSKLTSGIVSASNVDTYIYGGLVGASPSTAVELDELGSFKKYGEVAKPLITNPLKVTITQSKTVPLSGGKETSIKIKIDDSKKSLLKNSSTIKDFMIPIYRLIKSFGGIKYPTTSWFVCPLKSDGSADISKYKFYVPIIYDDGRYGASTTLKISDLDKVSINPPTSLKVFNGYGTSSANSNFFQPIPSSSVSINSVPQMISNAGLPSEYNILIYSGYPEDYQYDFIQIAFVIATYEKIGNSWIPKSWVPGPNVAFVTNPIGLLPFFGNGYISGQTIPTLLDVNYVDVIENGI